MEMHESAPPVRFGLDRLSPEAVLTLFEFIGQETPHLDGQFRRELYEVAGSNPAQAHVALEALKRSERVQNRWLACAAVPYLASEDPDKGFPLWLELMNDPDGSVWEAATDALSSTLGVLALQPEGVIQVIKAYFAHYEIPGTRQTATPSD